MVIFQLGLTVWKSTFSLYLFVESLESMFKRLVNVLFYFLNGQGVRKLMYIKWFCRNQCFNWHNGNIFMVKSCMSARFSYLATKTGSISKLSKKITLSIFFHNLFKFYGISQGSILIWRARGKVTSDLHNF